MRLGSLVPPAVRALGRSGGSSGVREAGVATDAVEQAVQRAATAAFIAADPTVIALQPRPRVLTAGGGYKEDTSQPTRLPQAFKVVWLSDRDRPLINLDGREYTAEVILVGPHDAQVARRDVWWVGDQEFRVLEVQTGWGHETKALAVRRG